MTAHTSLHFAIDGNEANLTQRVGSNVYAFQILLALREKILAAPQLSATILLRQPPLADWPKASQDWQYQVLKPNKLWTQLAEPLHLYLHPHRYDAFYTPGHYAPRACPLPYISSVMDLAYLKFPDQYRQSDLTQLKHWTKYSLKNADKVVAISQFTKQDLIETYHLPAEKIVVAPPAVDQVETLNEVGAEADQVEEFFDQHQIRKPFFLYLGTFQPRKNLIRLIEAYEIFCRRLSSQQDEGKGQKKNLPQLVLAGKIGWLAEPIQERITQSAFREQIITPGFVSPAVKQALYERTTANLLLGLYEGFGLPPLEALQAGSLPIVADNTSLPEAIGEVGLVVDPTDTTAIAEQLEKAYFLTDQAREELLAGAEKQLAKFSWEKSAQIILDELIKLAKKS